jgi:hypothetical protein
MQCATLWRRRDLRHGCFGSAEEFLKSDLHGKAACLIVDIRMPRIFITALGDVQMRIQASSVTSSLLHDFPTPLVA